MSGDRLVGRPESSHLNPISGRWLPDRSHVQRHVNIAIAYNVWQHYMVTGSLGFLRFTGAELLSRCPVLVQYRHVQPRSRSLRDQPRHGAGRVPRRLPRFR